LIEDHSKPVVALRDLGAEICLIKEERVRDRDLPSIGMLKVRGVLGEPVEARLVVLKSNWTQALEDSVTEQMTC